MQNSFNYGGMLFCLPSESLSNYNPNVHYLKMILDNASKEGLLAIKLVF